MLETTDEDREALAPIVSRLGLEMPNVKISVYKNRRGRWKNIYMWCYANRGICRFETRFITNWQYELIEMEDLKINITPKIQASAF